MLWTSRVVPSFRRVFRHPRHAKAAGDISSLALSCLYVLLLGRTALAQDPAGTAPAAPTTAPDAAPPPLDPAALDPALADAAALDAVAPEEGEIATITVV